MHQFFFLKLRPGNSESPTSRCIVRNIYNKIYTMEVLFLLLSLLHLSFSVKHSLMYYMTGSPGIPSIPDFMAFGEVDGIEAGYCDSNNKILQPRQDWAKETLDDDLEHLCGQKLPDLFKIFTSMFQILSSQNGDVHVLQLIKGCEWDENTDEVTSIFLFGYDGEDVLEFDWKTRTFVAMKPEYDIFTWIPMGNVSLLLAEFYTEICPWRLKRYLDRGKSSLQRTVLPSVSLLQKTPSSPVSCHATGFYPDRVMMFWRKDEEEIHENVYHTDVLPNNDNTFQMSVTLNVSSVTPEDWRRYDCVFQLSDPSSTIVTTLNNSVINTNWKKSHNQRNHQRNPVTVLIITAVVVVVLIALAAAGYFFCKKKKHVDNGTQLSENPNPKICD